MSTALARYIQRHSKHNHPIKHRIMPDGTFLYEGVQLMNGLKVPKSSAQLRLESSLLRITHLKMAGLWLDKSPEEEERWPSVGPIRPLIGESGMGFVDQKAIQQSTSAEYRDMWYKGDGLNEQDMSDEDVGRVANIIRVYTFKPDPDTNGNNWLYEYYQAWKDKKDASKEEEDPDPFGGLFDEDEDD